MGKKLLSFRGYSAAGAPRVAAEQLTYEWLKKGFGEPLLVDAPLAALGMALPPGGFSLEELATGVGRSAPVRTIDVASQRDGPSMTLFDWLEYWKARTARVEAGVLPAGERGGTVQITKEKGGQTVVGSNGLKIKLQNKPAPKRASKGAKLAGRLLNVVSLSLAGTPLELSVVPPKVVRDADLVGRVWGGLDGVKPKVQLYALMSPANSYTDWHVDFGGSSVWYHLISGKKVFAMAPPTEKNLQSFKAWASSGKQESTFFAAHVERARLVTVNAGETVLIPAGWPHAVYTPEHSVAVGGNFLHSLDVKRQLDVWNLEDALGVKPNFRFPLYKQLMWFTALDFRDRLELQVNAIRMNFLRSSPQISYARLTSRRSMLSSGNLEEGGSPPGPETSEDAPAPAKPASPTLKIKVQAPKKQEQEGGVLSLRFKVSEPEISVHSIGGTRDSGDDAKSSGDPPAGQRPLNIPSSLTPSEEEGVVCLVAKLKEWLFDGGIDEVPREIEDPETLLADLSALCAQMSVDRKAAVFVDYSRAALLPEAPAAGGGPGGHFGFKRAFAQGPTSDQSPLKKKKAPGAAVSLKVGSDGKLQVKKAAKPAAKKSLGVRARLGKKLGLGKRPFRR